MNQFVAALDLEFGGHTDVGRRAHNEDTYLIHREIGLVIVADGVGGHQSGEIASSLTCEVMNREISAGASLSKAIDRANTEVSAAVRKGKGKTGMGSTVVALQMTKDGYELAWVGDSRAYLWDGRLTLLTRDHSFVEAQVASGQISVEEARTHSLRNVILQAVGLQEKGDLEIGTNSGKLAPGSCLLLCSDGITDPMDNAQLCQLLSDRTNPVETCQRIVDKALQCGGRDNATAVLIANNGTPEDSALIMAPARVTWVYDPETAAYLGLPDFTMHHPDIGSEAEKTQILSVSPGFVSSVLAENAESIQNVQPDKRARGWRIFWLVALLGAVLLGLVYLFY